LFDIGNFKIPHSNSTILFVKKVLTIYTKTDYYIQLKNKITQFINKYNILETSLTIQQLIKLHFSTDKFIYNEGFPFTSLPNENFINSLDKISSGIMELYSTILILLLPSKNIIYYGGYYHSNNITYILKNKYDYKIVYSQGTTDFLPDNTESCISINKKIFDL
jgi:hypothetical protein